MFTHLGVNPFSMQYFTPERTASSLSDSLNIQSHLLELAPGNCVRIMYEDFVRSRELPLDQLPLPIEGKRAEETTFHSPNYAVANQPVYQQSVHRYEHYLSFMPPEAVKQFVPH